MCIRDSISDLRAAAAVFQGKKVADGVRCIVIPATQDIVLQAMKEGLIQTFIQAGCAVSTPTCGPCLGGHMGVMAEGERTVSTTNRNFVGRMGPVSYTHLDVYKRQGRDGTADDGDDLAGVVGLGGDHALHRSVQILLHVQRLLFHVLRSWDRKRKQAPGACQQSRTAPEQTGLLYSAALRGRRAPVSDPMLLLRL